MKLEKHHLLDMIVITNSDKMHWSMVKLVKEDMMLDDTLKSKIIPLTPKYSLIVVGKFFISLFCLQRHLGDTLWKKGLKLVLPVKEKTNMICLSVWCTKENTELPLLRTTHQKRDHSWRSQIELPLLRMSRSQKTKQELVTVVDAKILNTTK